MSEVNELPIDLRGVEELRLDLKMANREVERQLKINSDLRNKADGIDTTLSDKTKMSTGALIQELFFLFAPMVPEFEIEQPNDIVDLKDIFVLTNTEVRDIDEVLNELFNRHVLKRIKNNKLTDANSGVDKKG